MKRLILCNDGTWNTPDQEENGLPSPTNVVKLYNALADKDPQGVEQLKYYHPGVGAEGGLFKSIVGGAIGAGISNNIRSAYHWIATNYQPGDDIFLFGFSRGAFTARSLAGLLDRGLLDLNALNDPGEAWRRVGAIYDHYRATPKAGPVAQWADPSWKFHHTEESTPIRFIGVWDTVGALGIPDDLELLNLFDNPAKWKFHDTNLSPRVETARHAMAIDERRASFTVTRWANASQHEGVQEVWFPGVHCDVGGGYSNCDLSDGALLWMIEEAERADLAFRPNIKNQLHPDPLGVMHDSFKGGFAKLRSRPRNVDALVPKNHARFHSSAILRQDGSPINYPAYRPTHLLAPGQTSEKIEVYADNRWNDTGYFLEPGTYTFSASGQWLDAKDPFDWSGTKANHRFTTGDLARATSSFLGKFEALAHNPATDFLGTRRVEQMRWFSLVGAVANDGNRNGDTANDGSPSLHSYVELFRHNDPANSYEVKAPGYFYAFANDVWSLYGNNHGSVTLTITRKS